MKRFLISLAVLALFQVSVGAQTVFSVNVVGYVDLQLHPGSNLVANPFNAADNTVSALFGSLPDGSVFLPWDQGTESFGPTNRLSKPAGWSNPAELLLQPNGGFLIVDRKSVV